jgi:hypothetical protein
MTNLTSARQAIQSELSHARQGAAFYQARVTALEEALEKIKSADSPDVAPQTSKATKQKKTAAKRVTGRKNAVRGSAGSGDLPSTGGGFWKNLITTHPQSAPEILIAAVEALGISPSKEQLKKLSQRQTNALHNLIKAKAISDSGSGRNRRFFQVH